MNNQFLKKQQYLRKRQGNGGSPVDFYTHNDSAGPLVPRDKLSQNLREKTTVRIRTKNNEFVYGEASFHNPL